MRRQKKINTVNSEFKHQDEKTEVCMSQEHDNDNVAVLEELQTEIDKARMELEQTKLEIEEKKKEIVSANPRRDHDDQEMAIVAKQISMSSDRGALKQKIDKELERQNEMITGRFINRRYPGGTFKTTFIHSPDDPVKWYNFKDGEVYTIKRGFAEEIKEHYYRPKFLKSEDGLVDAEQVQRVDTSNKLYDFVPLSF